MGVKLGEILRSAQNDKIIYFFRDLGKLYRGFRIHCKPCNNSGHGAQRKTFGN